MANSEIFTCQKGGGRVGKKVYWVKNIKGIRRNNGRGPDQKATSLMDVCGAKSNIHTPLWGRGGL